MSKLKDTWDKYKTAIVRRPSDIDAAITDAEAEIERLTRERDEARSRALDEAKTAYSVWAGKRSDSRSFEEVICALKGDSHDHD